MSTFKQPQRSLSSTDRGAPLAVLFLIVTAGSTIIAVEPAYGGTSLIVLLAYFVGGGRWAAALASTRWSGDRPHSRWPENLALALMGLLLVAHTLAALNGSRPGLWASVIGMIGVTTLMVPVTLIRFPGILPLAGATAPAGTSSPRRPDSLEVAPPSPAGPRAKKAKLLWLNRQLQVALLHDLGRHEEAENLVPFDQVLERLNRQRRSKQLARISRARRRPSRRQGAGVLRRRALARAARVDDPNYDPASERDDEDNAWTDLDNITGGQIIAEARRLLRDFGSVRPDEYTELFHAHGFWELEIAVRDLLRIIDGRGRPRSR